VKKPNDMAQAAFGNKKCQYHIIESSLRGWMAKIRVYELARELKSKQGLLDKVEEDESCC